LVKQNLSKYLEQYRLLTDDINILDAFVVNIGVNFSITVFKNYNVNDVLARAIGEIQNYFDTSKWTVNQPIIVSDLIYNVGSVDGVQNVKSLEIVNKYKFQDGSNYQDYRYSIDEATVNGIIYPSLDPCIFELKYPQSDIVGSAVQ
jgi:phage-related baseplate assembly protein